MTDKLMPIWNEELSRISFDDRPANSKRFSQEMSIFSHVARCIYNGRNIFHLQPALSSLLRMTDIEDVKWESIKLPYPSFYLYFGPQLDWPLSKSCYVDGAYVETIQKSGMQITLTSSREHSGGRPAKQSFVFDFDPYYFFPCEYSLPGDTNVGKTLKDTLEIDPSFRLNDSQSEDTEQFLLAEDTKVTVAQLPKEQSGWYEAAIEHHSNLPVFMQAIRLVINGLCFLSAEPDDAVSSFPDEALQSINNPNTKRDSILQLGGKELRKLRQLGYTEVFFCGNRFVEVAKGEEAFVTGGEVLPHRRRAFWRNQTYGPGNSERRLKWIKPTIVRKDRLREGEEAPGHTYIVQ